MKRTVAVLSSVVGLLVFGAQAEAQHQLDKLLPADGDADDSFGYSVSIDGGLALMSAYHDDDNGRDSGSVYVFDADKGKELLKLTPLDGAPYDNFGFSVSLHGDLALVGAVWDDENGMFAGSAYLFNATTGQQLFKFLPAGVGPSDALGFTVAVWGERALVGCPGDDVRGLNAGAVYLFSTTTGNLVKWLSPMELDAGDEFGYSVAVQGDLAVVGAIGDEYLVTNSGAAYVFDILPTVTKLRRLLPDSGVSDAEFGCSVAISSEYVLVGARQDEHAGVRSGAAYLFDTGTWSQLHKLTPEDGGADDEFGCSVAISGDRILVGARDDDDNGPESGSVYVFDALIGAQLAKIVPADGVAGARLGDSVALQGNRALLGTPEDDDNGAGSGSTYLYDIGPGTPFGGGGSGYPCPCGNSNDDSLLPYLSGCASTPNPEGARLSTTGIASVANDTVVFIADHVKANTWGLFFKGDDRLLPGVPMGGSNANGLLQVTTKIKRFPALQADGTGYVDSSAYANPLHIMSNAAAGDTRHYQFWYRTPKASGPCSNPSPGGSNTSNGYSISWGA